MTEKQIRRSRFRHAGSLTSYATQAGQRWKFQIYVPNDPERPELGDTRLARGGFKSLDEAQRALDEALKKKRTVSPPTSSQVRAQKPEIATWTGHQLHAFLSRNRDELFPLWRTMAYTGMRRSEALALRWSDINFSTGRIGLRRAVDIASPHTTKVTKTGSARVIDIDTESLKVLKAHKADRGAVSLDLARADAYVFGDDHGAVRVPDAITSRWTRRLDWACATIEGLPRVTLKGLRHTHATLLLELGEHPKVVQERLGHSTITTTMNIYSHVTPTMQKSAIDRFAAHLGETAPGAWHIFRHMSRGRSRPQLQSPRSQTWGSRHVREGGVELPRLARRPGALIPRFTLKLSVKSMATQQTTSLGYTDLQGR